MPISFKEKLMQFFHRHSIRRLFKITAIVFLLLAGAMLALYVYIASKTPSEAELKNIQNYTASEVYAADGVLLGKYFIYERSNVAFSEISSDLIHALIATEDARFYDHSGVDGIGLLRVLVKSILLRKESSGGGSTLSQQLIKNIFPRKRYAFFSLPLNKLREAIMARKLEKVFSKEQILTLYLNTVPFGENAYGIKVAAKRFFDKSVVDLNTQEAAVLVGMLKAPTSYNPRKNPERSKGRRNVVLEQLCKEGYISRTNADSLKGLPLVIRYTVENHHEGLAPYFREELRKYLLTWCEEHPKPDGTMYNIYTDGLRIYTTLDSRLQRYAEEAVREHLAALQTQFFSHWKGQAPWGRNFAVITDAMKRCDHYKNLKEEGYSEKEISAVFQKKIPMKIFTWSGDKEVVMSPMDSLKYYQYFLQAGLLAMESESGYIKAWVGGIDHEYFQYDHVNMHTKRQVGSTFKPIVYASALTQGIEPCERFIDEKKVYEQYYNWSPGNSEDEYGGTYSMEGALTKSVNTISAELIVRSGIDNTIRLARKMGIESVLEPIPSLALGSADVSLTEMVTAYSVFANQGLLNRPVYLMRITDKYDKEIFRYRQQKPERVLSNDQAGMLTYMLQNVVNAGTASALRSVYGFKQDMAGKTGTTQSQADGWYIGYTPALVTGVWVGAEDRRVHFRSLAMGKGATTALPVWAKFTAKVSKDPVFKNMRNASFPQLSTVVLEELNCEAYQEPKRSMWDKLFGRNKKENNEAPEDKKGKPRKRLFGFFKRKGE
ncbi:MAG TPA: transglycosylase domain-containing protein [Cytophagaceae bacterium]|nr:transglycosylase domain-containing protein [Cytophagaceae bacterium]